MRHCGAIESCVALAALRANSAVDELNPYFVQDHSMAESNNPFIDHSASVTSRFPALSSNPSPPTVSHTPYTNWLQPQGAPSSPPPYQPQQQSFLGINTTGYPGAAQPTFSPQTPQQYGGSSQWGGGAPAGQMGYAQTGSGFAPSSQFGQQAMGQMNGFGTGYPQQQQQQQQGYGYGQQPYGQLPQQQQNQPYGGNSYLSQFDPYSPSNSNPSPQSGYSSTPGPNSSYYGGGAPSSANGPHPRQYVNTHKSELETWDTVSWKQALSTFESLKNAWEERKRAVEGRIRAMGGTVGGAPGLFAGGGGGMGGGYGGYGYNPQQQEIDRLNEVGFRPFICYKSFKLSVFPAREGGYLKHR